MIEVPVERVNGSKGAISVGYEVPDRSSTTKATATPGEDYVRGIGDLELERWRDRDEIRSGRIHRRHGDGGQRILSIRLVDPATGSTAPGPHSTDTMTIGDNDVAAHVASNDGGDTDYVCDELIHPASFSLDRDAATVGEGAGSVTFTVRRSGPRRAVP